jgi:uncharacterized protein YkwD
MRFKAMAASLTLVAATAASLVAVPSAAQAGGCFSIDPAAKHFAQRMNHTRVNHGLGRLRLDPQLSFVAQRHNRAMVKQRTLFHTSSAQFSDWVTRWNYVGENVGDGPGVDWIYKAFLHSPEHYANIVGRHYNHVGIDTITVNGRMWVTIQFEARRNPGTHLKMPSLCR